MIRALAILALLAGAVIKLVLMLVAAAFSLFT